LPGERNPQSAAEEFAPPPQGDWYPFVAQYPGIQINFPIQQKHKYISSLDD
jgi:hypothetical protein